MLSRVVSMSNPGSRLAADLQPITCWVSLLTKTLDFDKNSKVSAQEAVPDSTTGDEEGTGEQVRNG